MVATQVSQRNFWIWALSLHLLYLVYALVGGPNLLNDSWEYLRQARNISAGYLAYCGDLSEPVNYFDFSKRPPLYPFLLWLTGANTFFTGILLLQNGLSLFTVYLLRKTLIERGFYHPLWFGVLVSSSVSWFIYVNSIMSEVLLVALVTTMIYSYHRFLKEGRRWAWVYNCLLALAVFTKPVFFPFVVINLVFWLIGHRRQFTAALLPLLLVGVWFVRNREVTGKAHFSSISYINLLDYNAYYFNLETRGVEYAENSSDEAHNRLENLTSFPAKADYMQETALREMGRSWGTYIWFHIKGSVRGVLDPGNFDVRTFLGKDDTLGFLKVLNEKGMKGIPEVLGEMPVFYLTLLMVSFINKLLLLAGILVFLFRRGVDYRWKWALAGLITYVVFITGPINASRFMLAVWPAMVLCAMQARPYRAKT
ncbi:MAG TPA: hypothetical protein DCG19_10615 [Cryomorphaceae bacterium]|nr:hypothetical protein [Owenweeksia sp.]MBF99532.1 hypothetical protein [Owenweeksia sp.]HAD97849.1 hypothetical protein [Cryomorphaceae bacterium]HBF19176.1 hypothetical protein [Cryomorphaceae bacterium]|tara:strand:+ start:69 stop:1340 length:1272 start_codon:yes stop_codon:yes gene_type:complete